MTIDRKTDLPEAWGITREMMAKPEPRIPLIEPGHIPDELRSELEPFYTKSVEKWGTVPRYFQMLAHSPALVEAWQLVDSRVRFGYLKTDPEFLNVLQLVIVKTAIMNHGHFTTRQIVEITFLCGMWCLSARLTEPFHLDVELPEDRIEFDGKRGKKAKASAA